MARGVGRAARGRAVLALLMSCHPVPTAGVTLVATLLAVSAGLPAGRVVLVALAVLTGQLSIGWSNDLVDQVRDVAAGRTDKPAATGLIGRRVLAVAAAGSVVATLALSWLVGVVPGVVLLVLVAAGWAYNLGLKGTAFSALAYAIGFGALPAGIFLARHGTPAPPWWAPPAGALLGVGAHFANVLPDLLDDARAGIRGLPHRLGARRSVVAMLTVTAVAAVVVALGPPGVAGWARVLVLVVSAALLVTAGVTARRDPSSAVAFRCALGIAVLDVVVLVVAPH